MADRGDNEVGYGRPPRHSRFKKGQSGNPGGRPKVSKTMSQALEEALDEQVTVKVRGKNRRVPMRDLAAKTLAHKAAKGDIRAFAMIERMQARSAAVAGKQVDAGSGEPQEFEVSMNFEEGPPEPPDLMRLCDELFMGDPKRIPGEWRPLWDTAVELREFLREVEHLLPDSLKHLTR